MGLSLVSTRPEDIFDMGNLCSVIAKEKKKVSAPHSLSELLGTVSLSVGDLAVPGNTTDTSDHVKKIIDKEVSNNVWISRFREYLRSRDLEDEEVALNFLIITQPLQAQMSKRKTFGSTESEKRRLFLLVTEHFLSASSPGVLALDNTVLFNDLTATRAAILADLKVSEESLDELLTCRQDPLVRDEGLQPEYIKFAQQTSISQVACLLSLL